MAAPLCPTHRLIRVILHVIQRNDQAVIRKIEAACRCSGCSGTLSWGTNLIHVTSWLLLPKPITSQQALFQSWTQCGSAEVRQGRLGDGANVILWPCARVWRYVKILKWCEVSSSDVIVAHRKVERPYLCEVETECLAHIERTRSGYINPYLFSMEGNLCRWHVLYSLALSSTLFHASTSLSPKLHVSLRCFMPGSSPRQTVASVCGDLASMWMTTGQVKRNWREGHLHAIFFGILLP